MSPTKEIIAALHLPPLPGCGRREAWTWSDVESFALQALDVFSTGGIQAAYLQDLRDVPPASLVEARTVAALTRLACRLRIAHPEMRLGLACMAHGASGPLAVAAAADLAFVRLKVYVGAMVKAEGILHGCAHEAVSERTRLGIPQVQLMADVYDRTGAPVGDLALEELARQAVTFGLADHLVLTGGNPQESLDWVQRARKSVPLDTSLFVGGGATPGNVAQLLRVADGVIVGSALRAQPGWTADAVRAGFDLEKVRQLVSAARQIGT